MRRRAFITLLGSVAAALASDAHAQQQRQGLARRGRRYVQFDEVPESVLAFLEANQRR
jgi:hypothetical protein